MKEIRIYAIHPDINSVDKLFSKSVLDKLESQFKFIWDSENPDYLISSEVIFNRKYFQQFLYYRKRAKINIFAPGEAILPDLNIFDFAVIYDSSLTYEDRITRNIFMFENFDLFGQSFLNPIKSNSDANKLFQDKSKFTNFIYSNGFANPFRDNFFHNLNNCKKVDSLGSHLQNVSSLAEAKKNDDWLEESIRLKKDYKFTIAIENANMPGYTSEKIFTSLLANTIPIYWGNPRVGDDINPDCMINLHDYESIDEAIKRIIEIDENRDEYLKIISKPWRTNKQIQLSNQRRQSYIGFYENIFSQDIFKAKRVSEGSMNYFYTAFYLRFNWINKFSIKVKLIKLISNFIK